MLQAKKFKFSKISRKDRVGITAFYGRKFRGGKPFKASHKRSKGMSGLTLGRIVDHHFRAYCDSGTMPRGSPSTKKWMDHILSACLQQNLKCVRAQVPVAYGGVHTMLDGLAVTRDNKLCVLELKCTGQTRSEHQSNYDRPCKNRKTLQFTGKPNTERSAHQYQAG